MALPPPPDGWTRFIVKATFAPTARDFAVLDPATEQRVYFIDGKWGLGPKAEIKDAGDAVVAHVRGSALGIKHMTVTDAGGAEIASIKGKWLSVARNRMTISTASGESWELSGSILEREYEVASGGRPVLRITQKWLSVRDQFTLDVAPGVDPGVACAIMWAVDSFAEQR